MKELNSSVTMVAAELELHSRPSRLPCWRRSRSRQCQKQGNQASFIFAGEQRMLETDNYFQRSCTGSFGRSTQIKTYSWDNAQVILVGNKCDMEEERVISTDRGKHLAEQLAPPLPGPEGEAGEQADCNGFEFFETSAKDNINVKQTFERLVDIICDKMSETLETDPVIAAGKQNTRLKDTPPPQQPNCGCFADFEFKNQPDSNISKKNSFMGQSKPLRTKARSLCAAARGEASLHPASTLAGAAPLNAKMAGSRPISSLAAIKPVQDQV
ncbi:Ras-related protein Rab-3C, partial [Varanus komodoensis]